MLFEVEGSLVRVRVVDATVGSSTQAGHAGRIAGATDTRTSEEGRTTLFVLVSVASASSNSILG